VAAGTNPASNLVDFLKSMNGRTINLAVPGVGTGSDIEAEYFLKFLAKAPYQMIPFQGGAPAINATIGSQVDTMASTLGGGAAAQIDGGKLKGLGIAAEHRAKVTSRDLAASPQHRGSASSCRPTPIRKFSAR